MLKYMHYILKKRTEENYDENLDLEDKVQSMLREKYAKEAELEAQ